jgi:hypothetical protein
VFDPRVRETVTVELGASAGDRVGVSVTVPWGDSDEENALRAAMREPGRYLVAHHEVYWSELKAERETITAAFSALIRATRNEKLLPRPFAPIDPALAAEALRPIALAGSALFKFLFQPYDGFVAAEDVRVELIERAVLAALRRPGRVSVRCDEDLLLPWSFVYDGEVTQSREGSDVELERFWGFMHEIQVEHTNTAQATRLPASIALKAAVCPKIDSAQSTRASDHPLRGAKLVGGEPVWIKDANDLRAALRALDADALYVLGHEGHGVPRAASTSWIKFGDDSISFSELLGARAASDVSRPVLVFHNACESAPVDRWDGRTLPGILVRQHPGRVCLIGTTAEVPATFAMAFAREFWRRFLGGSTAGQALLDARVALLREYGNPFGLLYTLHGKADTHLRAPDEVADIMFAEGETRALEKPLAARFAEVCTDPRQIEICVHDAGVPRSLVYVHQSPLKAWESVCDVARRFGRTEALTQVVNGLYS